MRLGLTTAFVLIVLPAAANSQSVGIDVLSLHAGARARILAPTTGSKCTLITVISASPDCLRYILEPSPDTKSPAWQQISKMETNVGSHRHVGRGAGIGFLVGLVGGAALEALTVKGGTRESNELKALATVVGGLTLGAFGGLGGAVIGYRQRTEDWVPVILPRSSASSSQSPFKDSRP